MSSAKLNNWLNIVAAIGVIAGLVLVAYELNQNTKLAHAEYYRDNYRMWMDVSAVEIESDINDVFIRSIVDPESLAPRDLLDLNSWYILVLSIYDNAAREQEAGIVTATNIIEEWEARYYFFNRVFEAVVSGKQELDTPRKR